MAGNLSVQLCVGWGSEGSGPTDDICSGFRVFVESKIVKHRENGWSRVSGVGHLLGDDPGMTKRSLLQYWHIWGHLAAC